MSQILGFQAAMDLSEIGSRSGQWRDFGPLEVRRRLYYAPCVARRANATAFTSIGDRVVMSVILTPRRGKAMREDAAFKIFAKRPAQRVWACGGRPDHRTGLRSLQHARSRNAR